MILTQFYDLGEFTDWLQFIAAAATILATPWIVDGLRHLFKGRIRVQFYNRAWTVDESRHWTITADNKSGKTDPPLIVFPRRRSARIVSASADHMGVEGSVQNSGTHATFKSTFWPDGRPITINITLSKPSDIRFKAPTSTVREDFIYKANGPVTKLEVLFIARFRVVHILTQFFALTLIVLGRIIYLGFMR